MSILRDRLHDHMREIRTVDCHSHTALPDAYYDTERNLFTLGSYFDREIEVATASLGRATKDIYGSRDDDGCWGILKAVVESAGNTSYWRHNLVVYRKFFGLTDDELTDENWREVNRQIREKTADPDWYRRVSEDVCGLRTQIRNVPWFEDWEPRYFTCTLRMEGALQSLEAETRDALADVTGRDVGSLPRLKDALVEFTNGYNERGNRGIKLAHAYQRTLSSEDVSAETAAAIYEKSLSGAPLAAQEIKQFQDHIIFFLAEMAAEVRLVFQIHTGVQNTWGWIPDSDPTLLLPLIHKYREVKFDLFHMGFPYSRELGMMGKHCPNVYLNMAWAYVISMEASRQILSEWIDLVPGVRLLAFGSDVLSPEMVYGHLEMARSCLADILEAKVRRDFLSEKAACELLDKTLHDNAVELYGLE